MIKTFRHKQLAALWTTGKSRIDLRLHGRIFRRLDALDAAVAAEEMNLPGFDFHSFPERTPVRYTIHVNGPWCITFEFENGDAFQVDFEQYH